MASIYYLVESLEYEYIVEYVANKILDWPNDNCIIISQDSNAKVRIRLPMDTEEILEKCLKPFGMPNVNEKDRILLHLIHSNEWIVTNTYFKHHSCTT